MCYIVFILQLGTALIEAEKSRAITVRLSKRDLCRLEAVCAHEKVDLSTLLIGFVQDGLRQRVIRLYSEGKLTAGRGAEILGISLREFLELLERECAAVTWDSDGIREYLREREKTREFYEMLVKRSEEAKKHPEKLVTLESV